MEVIEILRSRSQSNKWRNNRGSIEKIRRRSRSFGVSIVNSSQFLNVNVISNRSLSPHGNQDVSKNSNFLRSIHVSQLLGICTNPILIISRYYPNGTLECFAKSPKPITPSMTITILRGIQRDGALT